MWRDIRIILSSCSTFIDYIKEGLPAHIEELAIEGFVHGDIARFDFLQGAKWTWWSWRDYRSCRSSAVGCWSCRSGWTGLWLLDLLSLLSLLKGLGLLNGKFRSTLEIIRVELRLYHQYCS